MQSLTSMKKIEDELLNERMSEIKVLEEGETESYSIMKDDKTGEHYLHYAYFHWDVGGSGEKEIYHQLMPLEENQVVTLAQGEGNYRYPEAWDSPFLRNGPTGSYVWFDPNYGVEQEDEAFARMMVERLQELKKKGADLEQIDQFFEEMKRWEPPHS